MYFHVQEEIPMNTRLINRCLVSMVLLAAYSPAQTIHGTVTDALSKKPIAGATISLIGIPAKWSSDTLGNYASDTVRPGAYFVKAEAAGFLKVTKKVILSSPRETGTPDLTVNLALYALAANAEPSEGSMVVQYNFPGHFPASIDIADGRGKIVRSAYDRSRAGGMRSYSWDGRDNNGRPVPPGRYTAKVVSGRLVMIRTLVWKGAVEATIKRK
jgi:hypothetical protein